MKKKYLYRVSLILIAFAIVFTTCKDPVSPEHGNNAYTHTVIFDKNHPDATGWTDANPKTKAVSSPATTVGTLPASPTRQNWQFGGWTTASGGNGTPFTASTPVTKNITVYAQWNRENPGFTIALNIAGETDGDSVTLSPVSGAAGDTVTITYTVASPNINNRLVFSGVNAAIASVTAPGSGTREYTISEADAVESTITINAVFTHTNLLLDTIFFTGAQENKSYGDTTFTNALANTGAGGGTITYSSVNQAVAMVNETTGEITIHGAGSSVISAEKASDGTYERTTAQYLLKIAQLPLIIDDPTVTTTRQYNGDNTAEVTAGALLNKVRSDTVSVSATATYNSANVATANLITVEYAIEGASAPHYIKPAEYTISGTIIKANGIEVASPPTATPTSISPTSITLTAVILVNNSTYQTVEYARASAATPVPASDWQDDRTFNGLIANTEYYFFARAKENDNYEAGMAKTSAVIKTQETVFTIALNMSGEVDGDSVTLSSLSGAAGDTVTINYTVASSGSSVNQLDFSGVSSAIEPVTSPGSGTRTYAINEADAANGTITINAVFNHTYLVNDIIAFTGAQENKTYGDATFTKELTNTGNGSGAVSFSSGTSTVATVNSVTGEVTIVGVGDTVITATKASDGNYAGTQAEYLLKVAQKQLAMSDQTVTTTKAYNGNTAATVTEGTLSGREGSDTVNVTSAATYNSANVAEANLITVVHAMSGADAGKYIKPDDYTIAGTISKASGIEVASPPTATNIAQNSITLTAVILVGNSNVQNVEYARATAANPVPTSGWQDNTNFTGLTANTVYYFFARSKESANYQAGTAKTSAAITTQKNVFTVTLNISGNVSGDSVTRSPTSGVAGDPITINYTVASGGNANNRLDFSGVSPAISPVTAPGTDTRTYFINEADAANGTITIRAVFNHTNLQSDTIAFTGAQENKIYGDGTFTKALTTTGAGGGTVTYSSSDTTVATVNNSGFVTILKNGSTTITATKASDGTYAGATAIYTLNVAQKQLTMSNQTVTTTKTYNNNTTAAVTTGTVNGRVGSDTVNVSTSATYNSANVAEANLITVVHTMSGADAGKYIKPADYTTPGTITKATGIAMGSGNITAATTTQTSVTLSTARLTGDSTVQNIEYARNSSTTVPTSGWQEDRTFNGLTPNTQYYFFARSKENANYNAGTAKSAAITTLKTVLNITLNRSGNVSGDSVTLSSSSGSPGDNVTINYTLARTGTAKNELVFSGVSPAIATVSAQGNSNTAQTGTRTYTINESDAANGTITITATFTHTNLVNDIIAFGTPATESKTYGDASFTKAVSNRGSGSGAISYSSSDTTVATVNSSTGAVTILKNGTTTITATKASDGTYAQATATYNLTVSQRQLTKANPTVTTTKTYNGDNTAAVTTVGALNNVVSGDTVSVSASATYNTADVGTGKQITVVYTIAGADAGKYIKPVNYTTTGTINRATGSALNANPTAASSTSTSVTLTALTLTTTTGQTIEYARNSSTTTPTSGWQDDRTFNGLTANTTYYFFARSKENTNYNAGAVRTSAAIRTPAATTPSVPPTKIDFENDAINKTYSSTKGGNAGTMTVIADPVNSGQKSLRITASGYNQAAIIPVNLPYALQNYATLSFRINIQSGNDLNNKPVMVYAAGNSSAFLDHGFGNPADSQYPQFAANLAGQTTATDFSASAYRNTWTNFIINLSPGSSIGGLKGDIYIAFGFNSESATYLVDDLVFTIKESFTPPVIPPAPTPNASGAVASKNYRNMFKELGKTDAEINAKVTATFNRLFATSGDYKIYYENGNEAYILDSGNDDVRSEGMSYGMMMCVQLDDQNKFDRLWRFARNHMYHETNGGKNSRGYFAWQVGTNGSIKDNGCAPDGEFYFATALLFAHARWGSGAGILNYRQHAMQLLYDMIHRDTAKGDNNNEPAIFRDTDFQGYGKYMTTFQPQGSAGEMTDPSYHLPAFYEVWAIELERDADAGTLHGIWSNAAAMRADATFYRNAVKASREFFPKTTNATTGLGPDYAKFDGTPTGNQPYFEYDAFRIAMNIAMDWSWWAVDSWQKTFADRIQTFFHGKGVNTYTALWQLNGTPRQNAGDHSPGLVACNAVASLAASHSRAWDFLDDFWEISMTPGKYRYYDGCLYMLGLLHVTGNFKAYLSSGSNVIPSSGIDPTTATFDKRTDLQKDIVVTMNLNGNTLSRISNGATNLTSGTNYTVNSNIVTLRKEYLAARPIGTTTLTFTFSAGSARTIDITIKETPPGGTPSGGTSYDFSTISDVTVEYTTGGGVTASINNGALRVVKTTGHSTVGFILTLNLGSQTLGNFSGIKFGLRPISGDLGYKNVIIEVPNTAGGTFNALGSNTKLISNTQYNLQANTLITSNVISFASTAPLTRTGELKIAFGFDNTAAITYEITFIELVP